VYFKLEYIFSSLCVLSIFIYLKVKYLHLIPLVLLLYSLYLVLLVFIYFLLHLLSFMRKNKCHVDVDATLVSSHIQLEVGLLLARFVLCAL
jgi:hypothetical protein